MDQTLLPLLTLVAGAALGLGSTLLVSSIKQRQEVTLRLLDEYLEVRRDIVDTVSTMTEITIGQKLTTEDLKKHRSAVSSLYFKHYDFVPNELAVALLLLHACLLNGRGKLFKLDGDAILPMSRKEMGPFIAKCSRFKNTRVFAHQALDSKKEAIRIQQAVKIHAQHVLYTLNKFSSIDDLLVLPRRLRKDRIELKRHSPTKHRFW